MDLNDLTSGGGAVKIAAISMRNVRPAGGKGELEILGLSPNRRGAEGTKVMTKAIVAQKVAEKTGMSRKDTMDAIEIFLESIKESLKQGRKVSLVGFGTFSLKEKNARNGRNPRTGDHIQIPNKLVATFKPGKSFREMVNTVDQENEEASPPQS